MLTIAKASVIPFAGLAAITLTGCSSDNDTTTSETVATETTDTTETTTTAGNTGTCAALTPTNFDQDDLAETTACQTCISATGAWMESGEIPDDFQAKLNEVMYATTDQAWLSQLIANEQLIAEEMTAGNFDVCTNVNTYINDVKAILGNGGLAIAESAMTSAFDGSIEACGINTEYMTAALEPMYAVMPAIAQGIAAAFHGTCSNVLHTTQQLCEDNSGTWTSSGLPEMVDPTHATGAGINLFCADPCEKHADFLDANSLGDPNTCGSWFESCKRSVANVDLASTGTGACSIATDATDYCDDLTALVTSWGCTTPN